MSESGGASARTSPRRAKSVAARLGRSETGLNAAAIGIAIALRFVNATSRITYFPRAPEEFFRKHAPFIITAWHGQAFMLPFVRPPNAAVDVLASRAADGELIARTLVRLGCGVIRGSGAADASRMHDKGAVAAFRGMLTALAKGRSVALTADFDKEARRKVGPGVVALSKVSRRPIVPVAFVSSFRREIGSSWDRTTLSLPFGRVACVIGDPVTVPRDADEAGTETIRADIERSLNDVTERAYAWVDGGRD